ncbi:MAG TPA: hypothetical protein VK081_09255, partial [Planctomycetota bacterium]|nr:hypothetical protein [Planctomycetota bacterium]
MRTSSVSLPLVAVLASSVARAQTPPCFALNDQSTAVSGAITGYAFSGPVSVAWEFTTSADLVVQAAQIFTQNTFLAHDMTLEIWSDGGGVPLARLGGGAWKISTAAGREWQGTNFDAPVPLPQGLPHWLVWTEPGSSLIPVQPGGFAVPAAQRMTGGGWTPRTAEAPKFRLFCNLLDAVGVQPQGMPCAGAAGLGTALTNQAPMVGNSEFLIDGTGFPPGAPAALVVGF